MTAPHSAAHWANLDEVGAVWGIRLMVLIYRLFGRPVFRAALRPVIAYYYLRNGIARRASRDYLRRIGRAQPELGITGSALESFRHFMNFGETLLDKLVVWLDKIQLERVDFHNRELLVQMLEKKQGAVLLSGHVGNLEICRALADLRGYIHLNILVHTKHAQKFNRLLESADQARNIELIQVTDLNPATAIRLQDKVQNGEFVVIVGDRSPLGSPQRTVTAQFLGDPVELPQGPYLLASLLRCPVLTLFSYPWGGRYHIFLEPFAESISIPRRDPARSEALREWAQRFADCLENHCRRVPYQWFNFYPFWDTPESAHTQSPGEPRP